MTTAIVTAQAGTLAHAGAIANGHAGKGAFADYRERKSPATLAAQDADLVTFADYLARAGLAVDAEALGRGPDAWQGMTWGLVAGFVRWMLRAGYAISTINRKLSTVKVYAGLAAKAGAIDATELALIQTVVGYGHKEGKRVDEKRTVTRLGAKKAEHVPLAGEEARALKTQPDTPQGRRDALLMALLLDHGLRVSEVALLQVTDFDLKAKTFIFYRPKVGKTQTHRLTSDTRRALVAWMESGDCPAMGPVLRGSRKGGHLAAAGMSERAITARVRALGEAIGVAGLSAHDLRHYWATRAARNGTDAFALRDAGGWTSLAMPCRYVEAAQVANEGVKL